MSAHATFGHARRVAGAAIVTVCLAALSLAAAAPAAGVTAPAGWPVPYLTTRWTGVSSPLYVTGDGTGLRTYLVERSGRVLVAPANGGPTDYTVFLDLSAKTTTTSERGLLGLAFAPDYASSGRFYVNYTNLAGDTRIARFTRDPGNPNVALPGSEQTILAIGQPFANHNGGWLDFGPDGYLYCALGDGGGSGDPAGNAQNKSVLLGKILRIDTEGGAATYSVPADNPFVGQAGVRPEIWALGLRNPWRNSFDASGTLWIADVGQRNWEEVNVATDRGRGRNYGWDRWEANAPYPPGATPPSRTGFTFPQAAIAHETAESVTGGYRYAGTTHPKMRGAYLFGDFINGSIWGLRQNSNGTWSYPLLADTTKNISSFGTDDAENLYLCSFADARIYEVGDANTYSTRLAGADRFSAAVAIAEASYPGWAGADDVVIASGEDAAAADPLAASGLCWAYDAPLLLVSSRSVSSSVKTALAEMRAANGPLTLHIVGGTGSVPSARVAELVAAAGTGATAERVLATGDRYDLAAAIATRMQAVRPADFPSRAFLANGADRSTFFDALAVSAVVRRTGAPVLLTRRSSAPAATTQALSALGLTDRWAAGGVATLDPVVLVALGVPESQRIAGADRYSTAALVAEQALSSGWLGTSVVSFAGALPDGVTGGAAAGRANGPLLVTPSADLGTTAGATFLTANRASVTEVRVLGGGNSVSDEVRGDIARIREVP